MDEISRRIMKKIKQMSGVECTCGWPAEGHSTHAQDCEVERAWDRAKFLVKDEMRRETEGRA